MTDTPTMDGTLELPAHLSVMLAQDAFSRWLGVFARRRDTRAMRDAHARPR